MGLEKFTFLNLNEKEPPKQQESSEAAKPRESFAEISEQRFGAMRETTFSAINNAVERAKAIPGKLWGGFKRLMRGGIEQTLKGAAYGYTATERGVEATAAAAKATGRAAKKAGEAFIDSPETVADMIGDGLLALKEGTGSWLSERGKVLTLDLNAVDEKYESVKPMVEERGGAIAGEAKAAVESFHNAARQETTGLDQWLKNTGSLEEHIATLERDLASVEHRQRELRENIDILKQLAAMDRSIEGATITSA